MKSGKNSQQKTTFDNKITLLDKHALFSYIKE